MTWITRNVRVDLGEVAERNFEGFLDLLSMRTTGTDLLEDIGFRAIAIDDDGSIVIEVQGDDHACREDGWKEALAPGDEVFWNDPDDGRCSAIYKIVEITNDDPPVYRLRNDAGSETEAWLGELS
jgi:hypothetical protein